MANSTFSGAVRSENGFKVINVASGTGAVTETSSVASTGIFTNKYIKHVGYATVSSHNPQTLSLLTLKSFVLPLL